MPRRYVLLAAGCVVLALSAVVVTRAAGCEATLSAAVAACAVSTTPTAARWYGDPVFDMDRGEWEAFRQRLDRVLGRAGARRVSVSTVAHRARLAAAARDHGDLDVAVRLLLDASAWPRVFGGPIAVATPWGLRYREFATSIRSGQVAGDSHQAHTLATLGQIGVRSDAVVCALGTFTVADVARDAFAQFAGLESDLEWLAIAAAAYAGSDRWGNRWGEVVGLDALLAALERGIDDDARERCCGGAHYLEALLHLLRADSERVLLGPERVERVELAIRTLVGQFERAELAAGGWRTPGRPHAVEVLPSLAVTSHLLELFLMAEPERIPYRGRGAATKRGCEWLWAHVRSLGDDEVRDAMCPCTHAAIALTFFARRVP